MTDRNDERSSGAVALMAGGDGAGSNGGALRLPVA